MRREITRLQEDKRKRDEINVRLEERLRVQTALCGSGAGGPGGMGAIGGGPDESSGMKSMLSSLQAQITELKQGQQSQQANLGPNLLGQSFLGSGTSPTDEMVPDDDRETNYSQHSGGGGRFSIGNVSSVTNPAQGGPPPPPLTGGGGSSGSASSSKASGALARITPRDLSEIKALKKPPHRRVQFVQFQVSFF